MSESRWAGRARHAAMVLVAGLLVATACAGAGAGGGGGSDTAVVTTRHKGPVANVDAPVASGAVTTPVQPTPAPASTGAAAPAPVQTPPPPAAPVPTAEITIAAIADASVARHDDEPCSSTSSQSIGRGELEVRRTGSTETAVVVRYSVSGALDDVVPLPGEVLIPAGAASVSVPVEPVSPNPTPPAHVHRSPTLTVTLVAADGYNIGAEASASITVDVDIDVFGCDSGSAGPTALP